MRKIKAAYLECIICHKDMTLEFIHDDSTAIREAIEKATCCGRRSFLYWGEGTRYHCGVDKRYKD